MLYSWLIFYLLMFAAVVELFARAKDLEPAKDNFCDDNLENISDSDAIELRRKAYATFESVSEIKEPNIDAARL